MICQNCQVKAHFSAQFCASCGSKMKEEVVESHKKPMNRVVLISMVLLVYIMIINWIDIQSTYFSTLVFDILFAVFVLAFAIIDWKTYLPLFRIKKVDWKLIGLILIITPICAYGVNILVNYLNEQILHVYYQNMYAQYLDSPAPLAIALLSVAVFPALFEELAFRGIVFSEFIKISSVQGAFIVSAVLFTLLHLSVFSILWILPMGLILARLRHRKATLWYGILLHFIWNATIVLLDYIDWVN